MQTISSGTGNSVSIAGAKGWINSGQWWSHSHNMVPQFEQKFLSDEHFSSSGLPRSLMALYFLPRISATGPNPQEPGIHESGCNKWRKRRNPLNLMSSLPLLIFKESAIPPRFTLPLGPATLRQIPHAQSIKGMGVCESSSNSTPPHWQLPSRCLDVWWMICVSVTFLSNTEKRWRVCTYD